MTTYRTGSNWGVTIVRRGTGPDLQDCFRREDDQLVAVVVNGDQALAERICELLNGDQADPPKPDPHEVIAAVAHRAAEARLELAARMYANCPGPHRWIPHPEMSARWCQACGYAEGGRRMDAP